MLRNIVSSECGSRDSNRIGRNRPMHQRAIPPNFVVHTSHALMLGSTVDHIMSETILMSRIHSLIYGKSLDAQSPRPLRTRRRFRLITGIRQTFGRRSGPTK